MDESLYGLYKVKGIACDGDSVRLHDCDRYVIGEISLKIYINGAEYASLLCLNQLAEELALGFLYNEGAIDSMEDVQSVAYHETMHAVMIDLAPGKAVEKRESLRSVTSGCGQCFTYINPLKEEKFKPVASNGKYPVREILRSMQEFVRKSETFRTVGGVHSVFLRNETVSVFNEDIGRHNCIDKISGMLLRNGTIGSLGAAILFLSGRITSEIIAKVIRLQVPVLVSRSAPTTSAVNLARKYNISLLGYVRENSGCVYSGEERLILDA